MSLQNQEPDVATAALAPEALQSIEIACTTRVDPPHVKDNHSDDSTAAAAATENLEEMTDVLAEEGPAVEWSQMRTQARQLANLLRQRQQALDRREANLQSQASAWEQESRSFRLTLRHHHEETAGPLCQLGDLAMETVAEDEQPPGPASSFSASAASGSETDVRAESEVSPETAERRWRQLLRAEDLLTAEQDEFRQRREEFQHQVKAYERRIESERDAFATMRRQTEEQSQSKRQSLERESVRLDAQHHELQRVRANLFAAQQETLEIRLAAEELWGQLAGAMPSATLTRSISRIRNRIADQFRLASADAEDQKQQLELLTERLESHHEKLALRRRDLQDWFQRRQTELERQAELFAAGEDEIRCQQEQLDQLKTRWHEERNNYQREIRDLLKNSREKTEDEQTD